jgi:hypothetical protein
MEGARIDIAPVHIGAKPVLTAGFRQTHGRIEPRGAARDEKRGTDRRRQNQRQQHAAARHPRMAPEAGLPARLWEVDVSVRCLDHAVGPSLRCLIGLRRTVRRCVTVVNNECADRLTRRCNRSRD